MCKPAAGLAQRRESDQFVARSGHLPIQQELKHLGDNRGAIADPLEVRVNVERQKSGDWNRVHRPLTWLNSPRTSRHSTDLG
jgi:hypothetical protein